MKGFLSTINFCIFLCYYNNLYSAKIFLEFEAGKLVKFTNKVVKAIFCQFLLKLSQILVQIFSSDFFKTLDVLSLRHFDLHFSGIGGRVEPGKI